MNNLVPDPDRPRTLFDGEFAPSNVQISPAESETQRPTPTVLAIEAALKGRLAATPAEFAAMFGRHATWGYRQLYAGRVKTIRGAGRLLIPLKEIERFAADTIKHGEVENSNSK
jgi:hypothetical protein